MKRYRDVIGASRADWRDVNEEEITKTVVVEIEVQRSRRSLLLDVLLHAYLVMGTRAVGQISITVRDVERRRGLYVEAEIRQAR